MKYFIANWKANKNLTECEDWIRVFVKELTSFELKNTIIICPPSPLIYFTRELLKNSTKNIYLGAQDVSCFEKGKYTGEVTASTLSGLVDYAIIGHSERRQYFAENQETLNKKIALSLKYGIEPIYCIREINDSIPDNVNFITYEPITAIGTGNNEEVTKVIDLKNKLQLKPGQKFLYGGSVNENNVREYLNSQEIDGLLIGTASLNIKEFIKIINYDL